MPEIIFNTAAVNEALDHMARAMHGETVHLIGIQRGGARVADALQGRLEAQGVTVCRADLDISFYRDDLDTIGPNPEVRPSDIPFDLDGQDVWVVDDVLYTGRTIRAALNELFDYCRPNSIRLAVLVDRGGRQLPIAADVAGLSYAAGEGISVKLVAEDPGWHIERRQVKS